MAPVTYLEAIRRGLWEEMERDPAVFCIGEDIGIYGGAFNVTEGFIEHFGPERIIDTPIAESAIVGSAFGAALVGMRPVAEFQFMDFISCAFNQITNMVAKSHYRWGAPAPLVLRGPSGGGVHGGPFHSQNSEMHFVHTPGLKVVCPATPTDAYGLIKSAIRDSNPVIFFEHKFLYRRIKEELSTEDGFTVPIGQARIARAGADISVITYAAMLYVALEAAEILAKDGIDVEVLDLRTLLPLDREAIVRTVKQTNKVIVLHEDTKTGGIAGEICAIINEEAFYDLDGPIVRITSLDTPVPFSPPLEHAFLPTVAQVVEKARWLKRQSEPIRPTGNSRGGAIEPKLTQIPHLAKLNSKEQIVPMSLANIDRAARAVHSDQTSPHVYMADRIDVEDLVARLRQDGSKLPVENHLMYSLLPPFAFAVCEAIRNFPALNSSVEGHNIHYHQHIHLAIESLDSVPQKIVVTGAEEKKTSEIEQAIVQLIGSSSVDHSMEFDDDRQTFTILFSSQTQIMDLPLVRQPQVAILAVGAVRKIVAVRGNGTSDRIAIRHSLPIVLSHDHRVIDGATAAQFLSDLRLRLESPDLFK